MDDTVMYLLEVMFGAVMFFLSLWAVCILFGGILDKFKQRHVKSKHDIICDYRENAVKQDSEQGNDPDM
jgi:hypothetical protein